MTVTLRATTRCLLCGYLNPVFMVATVRVNKRSMKTTAPMMGAVRYWSCPECWTPSRPGGLSPRSPYVLDPESAAAVAEYRAKRWGIEPGDVAVERVA